MDLSGLVVAAGAVGDADRGHERDPGRLVAKGGEDVAHAAVVDRLGGTAATRGAVSEHDRVDVRNGSSEGVGAREVPNDDLSLLRQVPGSASVSDQRLGPVALTYRFFNREATNAAGRADNEDCAGPTHAPVTSSTARSPLRVRG